MRLAVPQELEVTGLSISERYFQELPRLRGALRLWTICLTLEAKTIDAGAIVSGRVKTYRSTLGKVHRKAGAPRSWESLGDLVALKVVFPTQRGADAFTKLVSSRPDWNPILDEKVSAADELKYRSDQFDLSWQRVSDKAGDAIKTEVQVRTAAADAWYVVDHRLRYKGAVTLPEVYKRRVLRLLILTELFDDEVEAVIAHQSTMAEYKVARLYEKLTDSYERVTNGYSASSRPDGLLEILLLAYAEHEIEQLDAIVAQFCDDLGSKLNEIVKNHFYGEPYFVETRDWVYYEPETLLVAERTRRAPARLRAAISGTNYEDLLSPMMTALSELR
jgi:ppGpp synthetase/RelA/SpoT-type nucleotidyltranferase